MENDKDDNLHGLSVTIPPIEEIIKLNSEKERLNKLKKKIELKQDGKHGIAEVIDIWNKNREHVKTNVESPKKVFELYDRQEIGGHLQKYAQYCSAYGVKPTFEVLLDWLYSNKINGEKDEIINVDLLSVMIMRGEVYPLVIIDTLAYASKIIHAATKVANEFEHLTDYFDSIKELVEAINATKISDQSNNNAEGIK